MKGRQILLDRLNGREAAALIAAGAIDGLSIGYRARRSSRTSQGRLLHELDLWEVSVVAFPMQRSARITQIGDIFSSTNADNQRSFA